MFSATTTAIVADAASAAAAGAERRNRVMVAYLESVLRTQKHPKLAVSATSMYIKFKEWAARHRRYNAARRWPAYLFRREINHYLDVVKDKREEGVVYLVDIHALRKRLQEDEENKKTKKMKVSDLKSEGDLKKSF